MRVTVLAVVVVLGALTPHRAQAQDAVYAQQRYDKGVTLFGQGQYDAALAEFRGSYQILASPNTHLMIARSLGELGQLVEAFGEYEAVAREAADRAAADPRYALTEETARNELAALRRRLAFVRVLVTNAPAGLL